MKLQIRFRETDYDALPLYWEERGQESHAYLYLDVRDGEVWVAAKSPSNNTWSVDEHHKHVCSWSIPNNLTTDGLNELLRCSTLQNLLLQLCDVSEEIYNGNNYVSVSGEIGRDIYEQITVKLDDIFPSLETLEACDARWYFDNLKIKHLMQEGESIENAAKRLQAEARANMQYLSIENIENALEQMIENEKEEMEEAC
jgi:hypothetical protein